MGRSSFFQFLVFCLKWYYCTFFLTSWQNYFNQYWKGWGKVTPGMMSFQRHKHDRLKSKMLLKNLLKVFLFHENWNLLNIKLTPVTNIKYENSVLKDKELPRCHWNYIWRMCRYVAFYHNSMCTSHVFFVFFYKE